jgi:CheY-like chemotaxis protein
MSKINILVAEDNDMNQLLIKTILENNDYDVFIAKNGLLACEELKKNMNFYSIILMDIMMPVMNGYEASQEIRKNIDKEIPIIAVTADVTSNVKEKCSNSGMTDYISKPYNAELLLKMILSYL